MPFILPRKSKQDLALRKCLSLVSLSVALESRNGRGVIELRAVRRVKVRFRLRFRVGTDSLCVSGIDPLVTVVIGVRVRVT